MLSWTRVVPDDNDIHRIVPEQGFESLANTLPFLRATFSTHKQYSAAGVNELLGDRKVGMALRGIRQDHLVRPVRVLEEVVNPLLLHQPRGEGEVAFAVLHAIVARLESALKLIPVDTRLLPVPGAGHDLGFGAKKNLTADLPQTIVAAFKELFN